MPRGMTTDSRIYLSIDTNAIFRPAKRNLDKSITIKGRTMCMPTNTSEFVSMLLRLIQIIRDSNPGVDLYINIPHLDIQMASFVDAEYVSNIATLLGGMFGDLDAGEMSSELSFISKPMSDGNILKVKDKIHHWSSFSSSKTFTWHNDQVYSQMIIDIAMKITKSRLDSAIRMLFDALDDHCRISFGYSCSNVGKLINETIVTNIRGYNIDYKYPFTQIAVLPEEQKSSEMNLNGMLDLFVPGNDIKMFYPQNISQTALRYHRSDCRGIPVMTADGVVLPVNHIVMLSATIDMTADTNIEITMSGNPEQIVTFDENNRVHLGDNMVHRIKAMVERFKDSAGLHRPSDKELVVPWNLDPEDAPVITYVLSVTGVEELATTIINAYKVKNKQNLANRKIRRLAISALTRAIINEIYECTKNDQECNIVLAHAADADPIDIEHDEIDDAKVDIISQCTTANLMSGGHMVTVRLHDVDRLDNMTIRGAVNTLLNCMMVNRAITGCVHLIGLPYQPLVLGVDHIGTNNETDEDVNPDSWGDEDEFDPVTVSPVEQPRQYPQYVPDQEHSWDHC